LDDFTESTDKSKTRKTIFNDVADIKALKNHRCAKIIATSQILQIRTKRESITDVLALKVLLLNEYAPSKFPKIFIGY